MNPVRFWLEVATPNPLNGSGGGGNSHGARMAMQSLAKKQRELAYSTALRCLRGAGLPTRKTWVRPRVHKGVVVRPGFEREEVALDRAVWLVEMVRVGRGRLDPRDGLPASLKHVADGIADALAVNDGGPRVRWNDDQRREQKRTGVEVEISQVNPQQQEQSR